MNLKDLDLEINLIRHGDAASDPNHWSSPTTPLSEVGVAQVKKLALKLKNQSFDALYTSPFIRAKQTAEIIKKYYQKSIDLQEKNWLSEIDLGTWAGGLKEKVALQIPSSLKSLLDEGYNKRGPLVARILVTDKKFTFPSGESLEIFWKRVSNGLHETFDQYRSFPSRKIAFVGHGGSFTVILLNLLGKSFSDTNFPIFLFRQGDITTIRINNGFVFVLQVNPFQNS
ncbi:MAG: histidine phosphatase family protein [Candidatus Heimdallarchaeota archaeon]|nr:MAG: histidine phosphatase family protein [Candidatus Heimdallarchaeota archaeon]